MHYASNAQKYFTLRYHSGLITEGFFARCRNTNYLKDESLSRYPEFEFYKTRSGLVWPQVWGDGKPQETVQTFD